MARTSSLDQFLTFSRKGGVVSIILGGAGMITGPEYFWFAVALVNAGLILLCIDVLMQKWSKTFLRWVLSSAVLAALVGFNWFWVFVDVPLAVGAMVVNAEYPKDTNIGGIIWHPKFTELHIQLLNPTKRNYEDLNIVIKPNFPVAAIGQLTNYQGVLFEDRHGITVRMVEIEGLQRRATPLVLIGTDSGYRVRCEKLPGGASLKIIMAIVDVKYDPQQSEPGDPIFRKDDILRIKLDDGSTYWYGQKDVDHYTPRITPNVVKISGDYVAGQRRRELMNEVKIH